MKFYLFVFLSILLLSCKNDPGSSSKNEKPQRLFFSKEDYAKVKAVKPEFTDSLLLNQHTFLSMHFTLDKPLVQSLRDLAPNMTEEELLANGNFQFSFLVDDEQIYVENLNTGAGLKDDKTTKLEHTIRLISPQPLDYWGWFMWLKFMKLGGGQDALSEGIHNLKIEIRPYVNQNETKVGGILAEGILEIQVVAIPVDEKLVAIQPIDQHTDWEISDGYYDKTKIKALNKKIAQQRFENINGIVVVKEGKLLIEEYFNGSGRDSLHDPRSVGKSIASTMMGVAISEKYISSEAAQLKEFYDLKSFENYSNKKDEITLKSLLTMSSGFLGDDNQNNSPGHENLMYPTKDWVKFTLDLPIDQDKIMGKDYAYFTAGVVVLGDVIHKAVPGGLVDYADKKLFAPLNITNYKWEYTPQKVGNTAGGIRLRAIDFAKYGQLYKNEGRWDGQQILSRQWVKKSLDKQIAQSLDEGHYGYLFWNKQYTIKGKTYEVSYCSGNGGNKIFIFKDIPFVVVITASAYNAPNAHSNVDKMMVDYILPAILAKV